MSGRNSPPPKPEPEPILSPASESTDPAVQQLLASRHGHDLNRSAPGASKAVVAAAEAAIVAISEQLGSLGLN